MRITSSKGAVGSVGQPKPLAQEMKALGNEEIGDSTKKQMSIVENLSLCKQVEILSLLDYKSVCRFALSSRANKEVANLVISLVDNTTRNKWMREIPDKALVLDEVIQRKIDLYIKRMKANFLQRIKMEYFSIDEAMVGIHKNDPILHKIVGTVFDTIGVKSSMLAAKFIGCAEWYPLYKLADYFDWTSSKIFSNSTMYLGWAVATIMLLITVLDEDKEELARIFRLSDLQQELKSSLEGYINYSDTVDRNKLVADVKYRYSFVYHMNKLQQGEDYQISESDERALVLDKVF